MTTGSLTGRDFLRSAAAAATITLAPRTSRAADSRIEVAVGEPIATITHDLYGHFVEHLGGVVYDGVWVGEKSSIPNTGGIRQALIDHMRRLPPGAIRWPGGCFADSYDWRDGVGARGSRPRRTNQLQVLHRTRPRRLRLTTTDRCLWVILSRIWTGWRTALVIVKPETVIAWHRPRPVTPPEDGVVVAVPPVGGLHHRYERRAARTRVTRSARHAERAPTPGTVLLARLPVSRPDSRRSRQSRPPRSCCRPTPTTPRRRRPPPIGTWKL